jgi:hypothetical protein
MEDLPRRIRFPIRGWPNRSGIIGETMQGPSGPLSGDSTTSHRMANPRQMLRNHRQTICIIGIPMMFPGIGCIDIRRLSYHLNDHMYRAALQRP